MFSKIKIDPYKIKFINERKPAIKTKQLKSIKVLQKLLDKAL